MDHIVLSTQQQRKSLSSSKKKKRSTTKNVLGPPEETKTTATLSEDAVARINLNLQQLLGIAKLPKRKKNWPRQSTDLSKSTVIDTADSKYSQEKRHELLIGVNAVNRGIKSAAAVLLCANVKPMFLLSHLLLTCQHNLVPHLLIPNLSKTISSVLGFSCVAIGFKKTTEAFKTLVDEIKCNYYPISESVSVKSEKLRDINEVQYTKETCDEVHCFGNESKFVYLVRDSKNERVFKSDNLSMIPKQVKADSEEFIPLPTASDVNQLITGISNNLLTNFDSSYQVQKPKKVKKNFVIDNQGTKPKYRPMKVKKVVSNNQRPNKQLKTQ